MWVKRWQDGQLGIHLDVDTPPPPQTTDLFGTDNPDVLVADSPNQKVWGYGGTDIISIAHPGDIAYGGAGNDRITNAEGSQQLHGEEGNDILVATSGNDELYGDTGNDALQGGADSDVLDGGSGNDLLDGGAGQDVLQGGDGADYLFGGGSLVPAVTDQQLADPNGPAWGVTDINGQPGLANVGGLSDIDGAMVGLGNDSVRNGNQWRMAA